MNPVYACMHTHTHTHIHIHDTLTHDFVCHETLNHIFCMPSRGKRLDTRRCHTQYTGADIPNPWPVGSMLLARKCYVAPGDALRKKSSFDPLPGKAETERRSNFENLRAVYLWRQTLQYCILYTN